jgi:NADPH-dependent 2,4-dienoyl-CoA reductase/sulfur reductase-like enzyme/Fe-S-cluster-containing hydrogenase component 2/bacterioferritin-associated ferredoxin
MEDYRIRNHPILETAEEPLVSFYWNGRQVMARQGEMISSALMAAGIKIFGHHPADGSPQGMFCANGQCSQCTVLADGVPVKGCMTAVRQGMKVEPVEGLPSLPCTGKASKPGPIEELDVDVLVVGGGPAGLSAAAELGKAGLQTLVVDDKQRLGGKLLLQTHKFFGSIEDCNAGTRGFDIAGILEKRLEAYPSVSIWKDSTVVAVYADRKAGVVTGGATYRLVAPKVLLNAAGARDKALIFPGNTLPGVYGAGAFQTLVNRDLVKCAEKIFVIGGGNVGLIAAYHALQAGIRVVGLVEALPECGGYQVHADKIRRLGVPIMTGHTVLRAEGRDHVEAVTVAEVDDHFRPLPGTEKTFGCNTVLVAVGLNSINEFSRQAEQAGIPVFSAGDAREIAEASSAVFSGKIAAAEATAALAGKGHEIPVSWYQKVDLLKSHPGPTGIPDYSGYPSDGVTPVLHCAQKIPCNPCASVCDRGVIQISGDGLTEPPHLTGNKCTGCHKCLFICPGLAITLVDYRKSRETPTVSIPCEVETAYLEKGNVVELLDYKGNRLGSSEIAAVRRSKNERKTLAVKVPVPANLALRVAGLGIPGKNREANPERTLSSPVVDDDAIVCRCERVTAGRIRELIRQGVRDMNELKAITRVCMGACGGKTCESLIMQIFRQEGVSPGEITSHNLRPLFVETPAGVLAGAKREEWK